MRVSRVAYQGMSIKGCVSSGQSLVEVVVALGVVVALAVSLVTTTLVTQRSSRTARNNTQATKLVQEKIEQMRVFRDRKGFDSLVNSPANSCWVLVSTDPDPVNWTLSNTSPNTCPQPVVLSQTTFARSIVVTDGSNANQKVVTVTVTWNDPGGLQTVTNTTVLSNCVNVNTPC
jgi:type II secretory pathway pseudopilin PulG